MFNVKYERDFEGHKVLYSTLCVHTLAYTTHTRMNYKTLIYDKEAKAVWITEYWKDKFKQSSEIEKSAHHFINLVS